MSQLFVALSGTITYAKAPKELLDAAFDIPMDRLILTSDAPHALPATLGGGRGAQVCIPPYAAVAAEKVAAMRGAPATAGGVLAAATANLCRALGLPAPHRPAQEGSGS